MLGKQEFIPCKYPQLLHFYVYSSKSFPQNNTDKEVYDEFIKFMESLGIVVEQGRKNAPYLCFTDNVTYHYDQPNKYWVKCLAGVGYRSEGKFIQTREDLEKFKNLVI
ncbi:hypothetical protein [Vibrio parahaemolyticus]|uniref:hypothetical protein n=3 Tax=Vibrio parahaemolyticus TaxID=670 RepID=UPI00235EAFB1|nr:hypothetical protein [Vibrio parahaemolyticus]